MTSEGLATEAAVEAAGGRGDGGDGGDRLKHRWGDKVYTRRSKKAKVITSVAVAGEGSKDGDGDGVFRGAPLSDLGSVGANSGKELAGVVVVAVRDRQTAEEEGDAGLELSINDAALQPTTNCVESAAAECPQLETPAPLAHDLPHQADQRCIAKLASKERLGFLIKSKQEGRNLIAKFENNLETVREVMRKVGMRKDFGGLLQAGSGVVSLTPPVFGSGVVSLTSPVFAQRLQSMRPLNQLSVAVMGNSFGTLETIEKRTPKANQFYRNSEFILANDKFPPSESNKKSKSNVKKNHGSALDFRVGSKTFKGCSALLERLLKHHFSHIFDSPVDVKGLGLHDYFTIIKQPMDLGTVRERLNSNYYKVPREFAEDVRLTFYNAMAYNPEEHEVHTMAKLLLKIFEEKWAATEMEYLRALKLAYNYDVCTPTSARSTPLEPSLLSPSGGRFMSRSQTMVNPVYCRSEAMNLNPAGRIRAPKKPKARDLNKRDMTFAEKQKLSSRLQSLPIERIDGIIQIIKRRNSSLSRQSNEIEVDIDAVDAETLWELDRFITNQRKNLSKMRRKNELAAQSGTEAKATEPARVEATPGAALERTPTKRDDKIASFSSDTGSSSSSRPGSESSPVGSDARHSPALWHSPAL